MHLTTILSLLLTTALLPTITTTSEIPSNKDNQIHLNLNLNNTKSDMGSPATTQPCLEAYQTWNTTLNNCIPGATSGFQVDNAVLGNMTTSQVVCLCDGGVFLQETNDVADGCHSFEDVAVYFRNLTVILTAGW
ncbi:hypothetical protein HDU76_002975 [Blyttiomyces sp. JEL0837]|nr:hypothetical protein HDU76_002975 [Blyttiomyces sp. JEL0837]